MATGASAAGQLAAVGIVALLFGLGGYYVSPHLTAFAAANLALGALALAAAAALALRRRGRGAGAAASPVARRLRLRGIVGIALALLVAVLAERLLDRPALRWDATAEGRYTFAEATRRTLASLAEPVTATLFVDALDNRARSTRLLLGALADLGPLEVRERDLAAAAAEIDRFGIGTSNTVVLEQDGRFEVVESPTEGTILEGLLRLTLPAQATLYIARGEGEGRFDRGEAGDYTGLGAALRTEGYRLRDLVLPAVDEIPADAAALLVVAPRRPLRPISLAALDRWLAGGGRLVAMLEPGTETGLEALLERWGFALPDALVVDPASGPVEGDPPGVNPVVLHFASHPIVRGFGPTQMLFFRQARPVIPARKPEPRDELHAFAYSSGRAWLARDLAAVLAGAGDRRGDPAAPGVVDGEEAYRPLAAAGRYPRDAGEARIVVFGDAEFASNRYLRALYNLDVAVNAVHWAASRDTAVTLRPKSLTPDQFPLTPQQSLAMLFGVGLLIPELCLVAAALAWVRRRSS